MAGRRVTDTEVLEACIQKAIEGGWEEPNGNTLQVDEKGNIYCFLKDNEGDTSIRAYGCQFGLEKIIFNHDFAKALFGEEINDEEYRYTSYEIPMWQYHLQQMVISPNPIDYLRTWLEGEV